MDAGFFSSSQKCWSTEGGSKAMKVETLSCCQSAPAVLFDPTPLGCCRPNPGRCMGKRGKHRGTQKSDKKPKGGKYRDTQKSDKKPRRPDLSKK